MTDSTRALRLVPVSHFDALFIVEEESHDRALAGRSRRETPESV